MGDSHNDVRPARPGPQGTTLFEAADLDEVAASPSADVQGDIERAALVGSKAPFLDQRFVLRQGKTTLGRRHDNDIVLPDASVSARHAWIIGDGDEYRLMNILSTNGTFVNDVKTHEAVLSDGDKVRFGRAEFVFQAGVASAIAVAHRGIPRWVWVGAISIIVVALAAMLLK